MFNKIIISIILFFPLILSAQIDVKWSELRFSKSTIHGIVYSNNHCYMIKVNMNGFALSKKNNTVFYKYDSELKEIKRSFHHLTYGSKKAVFSKLLKINNKLFLLSQTKGSAGMKKIIIHEVDKNTLKFVGEKIELFKLNKKGLLNKAKFHIEQSPDKKLTLIISEIDVKLKAPRKFIFNVLDENLNKILKKEIELQKTNRHFKYIQTKIDNDGNIFMMGFQNQLKKDIDRSQAYFWRYLANSEKSYLNKLSLKSEKYIRSINFEIDESSVTLAGYYTENKSYSGNKIRGIVHTTFSKSSDENLMWNYNPFSKSTLHHFKTDRKKKKYDKKGIIKEYNNLKMSKILRNKKGEILIVGETEYSVSSGGGKNGVATSSNYSGNLIIAVIDKSNKLLWELPLEKKHKEDEWFHHNSYFVDFNNKETRIFYNNSSNKKFPKGTLSSIISSDGKIKTELMFSKSKDKILICPNYCKKIDDGKYLIYGRNWLKDKLGILTIKN